MKTYSPQYQLDGFIDRFTPEIAGLARKAIAKMRKRLPGAIQMVYDNYNALVVGFCPSDRPSDGIFSIAIYPAVGFLSAGEALHRAYADLQKNGTTTNAVPMYSFAEFNKLIGK